eukprot:13655010-Ditylum_brightwellii.AAC.1
MLLLVLTSTLQISHKEPIVILHGEARKMSLLLVKKTMMLIMMLTIVMMVVLKMVMMMMLMVLTSTSHISHRELIVILHREASGTSLLLAIKTM